jgi:hypothetical protein
MFVAFLNGASKEHLAAQYDLTLERIEVILRTERHKAAVSPDPDYRQLRQPHLGHFLCRYMPSAQPS